MKPKYTLRAFLLGCSSLLAASSLHAADVTWDITPGTVGTGDSAITGGAGTWNTTASITPNGNWTTDAGANNVAWDNGNNDIAIFSDTGDTVTLGTDINLSGLKFTTGGYTIDGGGNKLILGNNGGIRSTNTPPASLVGSATINADIDTNGFRFTTVEGTSVLTGVISGSGGFATYNTSNVTLSGANTYTGKTDITSDSTSGSTLSVSSFNSVDIDDLDPLLPLASSSLGAPTTVANGTILIGASGKRASCTLTYTGTGETTDRVVRFEFNSSSSETLNASGSSGLLKFTSAMTSNANGTHSGKLFLGGTGDGEIVQSLPTLPTGGLQKQNAGTWTLGGTSSANATAVTGGTLILGGTLNTTNTVAVSSSSTLTVNGSLGFGATTISNTATVDGSGSLSFDIDGTTSDLVTMTGGTLTATGLTIAIVPGGVSGLTASEYVLVNATGGTISGTFAGLTGATGYELNYDTPGQVKLVQTGGGSAYDTWAGTNAPSPQTPDQDYDGDGVSNAVEFVLGGLASTNDLDKLPAVATDGTDMTFTFVRDQNSIEASTVVTIEAGTDLATWPDTYSVPGTDTGGVVNPGVTVASGAGTDTVTLTVPQSAGKKFARLKVVITP